jgi:hypothetical protein
MASIIRIKRSSVSGNPATLAAGELAYSALADNGSNGGDRLYVGMGTETSGNAANHVIIGGKYYTGLVDAGGAGGTLTTNAKSIPVLSATGTIDKWYVGNLYLNGNTLTSTNTNGDINVTPNGTGKTIITNIYTDANTSLAEYIQDATGGQIIAGTGITVTYDDTAGSTTIATQNITLGTSTLTNGSTTLGLAGLTSLGVSGNTTITGTLSVGSDFAINTNKFNVTASSGNTTIAGTLGVTGATTLSSTLAVTSNATVGGTLGVTGNTTLSGTLGVTGAATLSSTLAVTSNATVGGTLGVTNDFAVNTNKFTVAASTGNTAVAGTLAVTGQATFSSIVDMTGHKITNLAEPTADSDAATKYYVDAARSGLDIKNSVKAATTANITLSNTQTIDGVALSVGDRILVKNQTDPVQNGIYVVAASTWSRATDADQPAELNPGTFVFVEQGTVNSDTGFVVTSDSVLTIGTDAINWTLFSTSGTLIAGNGLSKNGYTLEVNVANGIEVSSDNVQLAATVAGAGLTYTSGVLDVVGTADRITVNANSVDIASTYIGQSSITTLGTITTGTWTGSVIADAYIADDLTISGGTINNTPIGATTRSTGAFTTLAVTNGTTLSGNATVGGTLGVTGNVTLSANITGAGAATSTLDGFNIDGGTY